MRVNDEDDTGEYRPKESLTPRDLISQKRTIPVIAYIILCAAVCASSKILAVSSAAVVFKILESDVPAITSAAWRLQATSFVLLPLFVWQWRTSSATVKKDWWHAWGYMTFSGACLAAHFCTWVWGLARTSLPHALLFVTSTPLLIAAGCLIFQQPISKAEVGSALAGFLGMVICELATWSSKGKAAVIGDLFSLLGALSIIGYLQAGRSLRSWMPIFLYALPVTAVSAIISTAAAVIFDGAALLKLGPHGLFGYFDAKHFWWVLYLALGPGLVGHTGFNTLLRFFPTIVISMAFPLEPIVGSVIGAIFGVSALPGALTWVGGLIMVGALVTCTYTQGRLEASKQKKKAVMLATQAALNDDDIVELAAFSIVENEDSIHLVDEA